MKAVLGALAALAFLAGNAAGARAADAGRADRNLFAELLGKTQAETDARIEAAWQQLFYGNDASQRVYYPVGADQAYIADVANRDVRTEGLSYGMMIAVQLDHRAEFDRLWHWAWQNHRHAGGPLRGYFAWHADFQGKPLNPGPAPDGEEWIATALFFAAHRWDSGEGISDYESRAQELLRTMLHKDDEPGHDNVGSMFDRASLEVVFSPDGEGKHFTDPSYHLPAFYELWARWAAAPADRELCARIAAKSRAFLKQAAHPVTGLMPDFAEFDGRAHSRHGPAAFRYDAWRTLSNPALDHAWFGRDPWEVEQSDRVLRFLSRQGPMIPNSYLLDGTPVDRTESSGLIAMAATAGLAADAELARPFVGRLWAMPVPEGQYRYYDGMLYLIALLEAGGRFQIIAPRGTAP